MSFAGPVFPSEPDVVRWWGRSRPERTALVDRRRDLRLSYAELSAANERWAELLRSRGVTPGDRVAILAGNRWEVIAAFGGCLRVGAILVPLNWRLAAPELSLVLGDAAPRLLVGEGRFRATAERALALAGADVPWLDLDDDLPGAMEVARSVQQTSPVSAHPDAPTMLLYTSGSTGRPKGVVLPHRQLFYNSLSTTIGWELGAGDVGPVATPFFHTGGWHVVTMPLFHVGGRVVLFDSFDPRGFLEGLAEERCTFAFSVPTQITMLTECAAWGRPLPELRWLISGGAPCPDALAQRVRDAGIPCRQGFGLTEFGPNCFAISNETARVKRSSVGWPMPFVEMRLAGDGGATVATGEPGELLLRGPQMFSGYWRDEERTAEALTDDGWLRTGDLAIRDEDGSYRICGRRKEMYISGGENVFPGEVEAALADCPGISEVVVIGVPDEKWGEVGRAFVVPRPGATLAESQIVAHARQRLAGYKVPKSVVIVGEIPRLGSGKADRASLAARR